MPSIGQLIIQDKFRSEKHKAVISIIYANNLIHSYYDDIFKRYGLSLQQYNALRILRGQHPNPCTVNLIRERMLDKMSDASRIVERLRKAGLAERITSRTDRRAVDVVISKKGLAVLAQIDKIETEIDKPTDNLTEKEAISLNEILEKVFERMIE